MNQISEASLERIGTIVAGQQVVILFGDANDSARAYGVITGIVATVFEVLPPEKLAAILAQWEIDCIQLAAHLESAGVKSPTVIES